MSNGFEVIPENFPAPDGRPKVLFVHGAWHDAKSFRLWIAYFRERGYDAGAFSFRGHGGSMPPKRFRLTRLGEYVDDLERIIVERGLKDVILVGWSMGGLIVQMYLNRHLEHRARVVLLAPVAPRGVLPLTVRYAWANPGTFRNMLIRCRMHPVVDDSEKVATMFFSPDTPGREELAKHIVVQDESVVAYIQMLWPRFSLLRKVTASILVIWAEQDALFNKKDHKSLAKRLPPRSTTHVITGSGHGIIYDAKWEEAAKHVIDWLDAPGVERPATE